MEWENMDVYILLSILNMKLRNYYRNLEDLCEDLNINLKMLVNRLQKIGYQYSSKNNQFIATE